jgi:uncharacterized membrane protein YtjA (UPF0391 family)
MLYWALVFAVLALAVFVGLGGTLALSAKVLLFVFVVLMALSVIVTRRRGAAV